MLLLGTATSSSSSSTRVLNLIMGFCTFACTNLTSCRQTSSCVENIPFAIHNAALIISLSILFVVGFGFCSLSGTQSFCLGCYCNVCPIDDSIADQLSIFQQLSFVVPALDHHSLNTTSRNALQTFLFEQAFSHLKPSLPLVAAFHISWKFPKCFWNKSNFVKGNIKSSRMFLTCWNENFKFN
jgi:hypothetical protein